MLKKIIKEIENKNEVKRDSQNKIIISERRFQPTELEIREVEGQPTQRKVVGYAVRFDSLSEDLGGFKEVVLSTAFDRFLAESKHDVFLFDNHNSERALASTASKTLKFWKDSHGIRYEAVLNDSERAKQLIADMQHGEGGLYRGTSFGFAIIRATLLEEPNGDIIQELRDVELYEISPVYTPAYSATSVGLRELKETEAAVEVAVEPEPVVEVKEDKRAELKKKILEAELKLATDKLNNNTAL
jgi:HK97 family phage prohead protease